MLRPGLHFSNACEITPADLDIVRLWSPVSLLLAMDNVVPDSLPQLKEAWEVGGRPPVVLRRYFTPREGNSRIWGIHAHESVAFAREVIAAGIPARHLMLKPFNEPNMPPWAQWEGFGPKPEDMESYNRAILEFCHIARNEIPGIRIGGPHLTVGNRDVKFPNDPPDFYYYHGRDRILTSSPCYEALLAFDVHFVHTYGMYPGQYRDRAHGLRFLEYEKYLRGKDVYVVEGAYAVNSGQQHHENTVRGPETVDYLRILGDKYPQVKGISLWIGGDRMWDAFRYSGAANPESHRPAVWKIHEACLEDAEPEPEPEPNPDKYKLVKGIARAGIPDMVDLRDEIESFSDMPHLWKEHRAFREILYFVLHHTGDERYTDPLAIAKWHVLQKPGAKDPTIPYHFMIRGDGRLFFTARLIWKIYGSGLDRTNREGVQIALIGDFRSRDPDPRQIDTLRRLTYALGEFFGGDWGKYRGSMIVPHNLIVDTACPGRVADAFVWAGEWPRPGFL